MTTGVMTSGSASCANRGFNLYRKRTWQGANGKYTTRNGKVVLKHNDYTIDATWHLARPGSSKPYKDYNLSLNCGSMTSGWTDRDDVILQGKLADQIRGHSFNAGVFAAESTRTVGLILTSARSIANAMSAVRHGNFHGAWKHLAGTPKRNHFTSKDVSGRWLELQYGWMPLLSDAHSAGEALARLIDDRVNMRVRVSRRVTSQLDAACCLGPFYIDKVSSKRITCDLFEDIPAHRAMGLQDPLSIAWELLPYSFVFDWFIPVGTMLGNMAILPYVKGEFITNTRVLTIGKGVVTPGKKDSSRLGAETEIRRMRLTRVCTTAIPVARPDFSKSLKQVMSPLHFANALALLRQKGTGIKAI